MWGVLSILMRFYSRQLVRDLLVQDLAHRQRDDHALGLLEETVDLGERVGGDEEALLTHLRRLHSSRSSVEPSG